MASSFRPDPKRQAILVGLALGGLAIGYGLGFLAKRDREPPSDPVTVAEQKASLGTPVMPEHNGKSGKLAYEEPLPKEIIEENVVIPPPTFRVSQPPDGSNTVAGQDMARRVASPSDGEPSIDREANFAGAAKDKASPGDSGPPEQASLAPEPSRPESEPPAWRRNAVAIDLDQRPKIAIVIDDMGVDRRRSRRAWNLSGPLTVSFLTYAQDFPRQMAEARAKGHELLLHVPMEPLSSQVTPGPNVLLSGVPKSEIAANLNWMLDQADGYVGVNNHMGSRFTADEAGMNEVMEALGRRGFLFLDSLTSPSSKGRTAAKRAGVPFIARNVFLDHIDDAEEVRRRLEEVENIAKRQGYAVAIGHPRDATLNALEKWLAERDNAAFQLVPVSALIRLAETSARDGSEKTEN